MADFLQKFWWARGAVAALALISFLSPLLDLKRYEILTITHAIITKWTLVLSSVIEAINVYVVINLHPLAANVFIAALASALPLLWVSLRTLRQKWSFGIRSNLGLVGPIVLSVATLGMSTVFAMIIMTIDREVVGGDRIRIVVHNLSASSTVQGTGTDLGTQLKTCLSAQPLRRSECFKDLDTEFIENNLSLGEQDALLTTHALLKQQDFELRRVHNDFVLMLSVFLLGCIIMNCFFNSRFRMGVFHFSVFIFALEVFYFFPLIGDLLHKAAEQILEEGS